MRTWGLLMERRWNENQVQRTGEMMEIEAPHLRCVRKKRLVNLTKVGQREPRRTWVPCETMRLFKWNTFANAKQRLLGLLSQGATGGVCWDRALMSHLKADVRLQKVQQREVGEEGETLQRSGH